MTPKYWTVDTILAIRYWPVEPYVRPVPLGEHYLRCDACGRGYWELRARTQALPQQFCSLDCAESELGVEYES